MRSHPYLRVAVVWTLASLPGPEAAEAQTQTGKSFVDEFNQLGSGRWYVSDGWANGDHQNCVWSKRLISITDGVLELHFRGQPSKNRSFGCAEIQTRQRFGYGVYEARLRTDVGSGLNASFFTYIGPIDKKPHDEIDVEILTRDTSRFQANVYSAGKGGNEKLVPVSGGTESGFNDYAFVWEPGRITWYLNGESVYVVDDIGKLPKNPQKIFFSFWGSETLTDWMGPFMVSPDGAKMQIDRVAFTALGDACQFEGSVACALH